MASNSTISITFKLDGDGKGFRALASDANGFKAAVTGAIREAERLNTGAINFAAIATAVDQAQGMLRNLESTLKDFANAYAIQEVAEKQLETVMRQRMSATDADIQGIKDLASAQQQLGVIGDEVQLAGAQQVATFLTQKSSIEVLLPAMNDLLAQQKGLNATGNDAVSIGNLMGKAMQGQTSALKRVGITFTSAQEQVMKYGDESQRASMLAQIITDNVGHMNAELAKTDSGKQKQLENTLGDIKEQLGKMTNAALPFVTIAANSLIALGGVVKLVAGIRTAAAAMAAWNVKGMASAVMCSLVGVNSSKSAALVRVFSSAMRGGAYSATALKLAVRGLLIATGVGAAITALTLAIEYFMGAADKAADSANNLIDAEKRAQREAERTEELRQQENRTLEDARAGLALNISRLKEFNGTKAEEKKLVAEMNDTYGETMGYFASVSEWYKALISNSEAYCKQMVLEARTRMLANQIAQKQQENYEITHNADGSVRKYSTKRESRYTDQKLQGYDASGNAIYTPGIAKEIEGSSDREKAQAAYDANISSVKALTEEMNKTAKDLSNVTLSVKGSAARPDDGVTGKSAKSEAERASEINVEEVMRRNLTSVSEYDQAISDLRLKQKYAGKEEYSQIEANITKLSEEEKAFKGVSSQKNEVAAQSIDVTEVMNRNLTSVSDYEQAISDLRAKQKYAGKEEYAQIEGLIVKLTEEEETFRGLKRTEEEIARSIDVAEVMSRNLASISDYDQAISELRTKQKYASKENAQEIQRNIDLLNEEKSSYTKTSVGNIKIDDSASTLQDISKNIDLLTGQLQTATMEEAAMLNGQIALWEKKADAIRNAGKAVGATFNDFKAGWSSIKGISGAVTSISTALESNTTAWEKTMAAVDSIVSVYEGINTIIKIVETLTAASTAHTAAKTAEATATTVAGTANVVAAAEAEGTIAAEIPMIATNKAAAASFLEMAAASYFAAHAYIPFAGFGIASGFAASAAAVTKAMGVMAFADGCIAYGPTLGLFGEYAGAGSNPEVVAPLDRLKDLIGDAGGIEGRVEFEIRGDRLYGVLKNYDRKYSRV